MKRVITLCALTGVIGITIGMGLSQREDQLPSAIGYAHAVQPTTDVALNKVGEWNAQSGKDRPFTIEEQTNIYVYEHANPSVVNINTRSVQIDHFFRMQREAEGSGSGAILDRQGHILTNYHVIDGIEQELSCCAHRW
jgi:S1-C subfamily serine protease